MAISFPTETASGSPPRLKDQAGKSESLHAEQQWLIAVMASAAKGDEHAWNELANRFGTMILSIARSCRLNEADVGEVFQTTWLRLVENIHRIEQPERVGAWLATTSRRESFRLVRGKARVDLDGDSLQHMPEPNALGVDSALLADERAVAVRAAFELLPLRCQRLLTLMVGSDPPSYQEISKMLDMPIGSIGPTRGRCLDHLRRLLFDPRNE